MTVQLNLDKETVTCI